MLNKMSVKSNLLRISKAKQRFDVSDFKSEISKNVINHFAEIIDDTQDFSKICTSAINNFNSEVKNTTFALNGLKKDFDKKKAIFLNTEFTFQKISGESVILKAREWLNGFFLTENQDLFYEEKFDKFLNFLEKQMKAIIFDYNFAKNHKISLLKNLENGIYANQATMASLKDASTVVLNGVKGTFETLHFDVLAEKEGRLPDLLKTVESNKSIFEFENYKLELSENGKNK